MSERRDTCPLCGGHTEVRYHENTARHYRWCLECDLISVVPEDRVSRESETNRYLEHDNGFHKTGYVRMLSGFLDTAVDPWVPQPHNERAGPPRLLDYGCGYAPVMTAIARGRGYQARGWDPFFLPDSRALQQSYDAVAACEVIEHVAFPGNAFSRVRALLRPGGIFAVRSSLHPSTWKDFFRFWYIRDRTHVSYFSRATVEYCARRFGFTVELCDDPFWTLRTGETHGAPRTPR
ncbi:MAG: class I SAM-dependent methyltransferase [Spirochaetia bacterium]